MQCCGAARWQTCLRSRILAVGIDSAWNDNNEYELWDEEAVCKGRVRAPGRKPSCRGVSSMWQLARQADLAVHAAVLPCERILSVRDIISITIALDVDHVRALH